jgi:hypothetical protein
MTIWVRTHFVPINFLIKGYSLSFMTLCSLVAGYLFVGAD